MNYQVNSNIVVLIDAVTDSFSQQQVYVQWYILIPDGNGNLIIPMGSTAKISIIATSNLSLINSLVMSYTSWRALSSSVQIIAIQNLILSNF